MSLSDRLLVQEALSGNKTAFGPLVERHRAMVLRLARRIVGDPADAEDIVQEACLQAFLGLARLRDPERFAAWLYGIVVNLCRMRLRRGQRQVYSLEDMDGGRVAQDFMWVEAQPSLESAYQSRELRRVVLDAIALLTPEQQIAVKRHYLDGLPLRDIGLVTGTPVGTVKARLHRARKRLRAELAQELSERIVHPQYKEEVMMVEMVVQDVVVRMGKPKDMLEADSREQPAPGTEVEREPLPPAVQPGHRVVLLKERTGERILPIWIGPHEADLIALQLAEKSPSRPLTFDLMARLLEAARVTVQRVAVSRLHEEVFYATLWVGVDGEVQELDARPSDALALALRVKSPIFVDESILSAEGVAPQNLQARLDKCLPEECKPLVPEAAGEEWQSLTEIARTG